MFFLNLNRSAPELGSLWNPSLRKTLSHPAAVHLKEKNSKSVSQEQHLGTTATSKSVRNPSSRSGKIKKNSQQLSITSETSFNIEETHEKSRKYSCPNDKPSSPSLQTSPPKGKRTFLEGLRNPLRQKKHDEQLTTTSTIITKTYESLGSNLLSSHSLDYSTDAQKGNMLEATSNDNSVNRRWSESATPLLVTSNQHHQSDSMTQPNDGKDSSSLSNNHGTCLLEKPPHN